MALIGTPSRVVPVGVEHRVLHRGRGEAGVRMRRLASSAPVSSPAPCQSMQVLGRIAVHAFPPHVAVVGERDVGEDAVGLDGLHRAGVGRIGRAGRDAEVAGLGVDRVETSIGVRLDPGDVVADGGDLPVVSERPWAGRAWRSWSCRRRWGTPPRRRSSRPRGDSRPMISMCSASQPSSRAITDAIRSARHFLPSSALPP